MPDNVIVGNEIVVEAPTAKVPDQLTVEGAPASKVAVTTIAVIVVLPPLLMLTCGVKEDAHCVPDVGDMTLFNAASTQVLVVPHLPEVKSDGRMVKSACRIRDF